MTATSPPAAAVQRRILAVLAVTQVLAGVGVATAIALATLVATRLSGSETVGGAALTMVVLGTALAALAIARVAARGGRRPSIALGYLAGAVGGVGAVVAVSVGSAVGLLASLLLVGAATAAGLAARFAATDLAEPGRRARALSLVVWATTVGAVAGPNLAEPVRRAAGTLGMVPETGPFLLCAVAFGLAAAGVWVGLRPDPLLLARAREGGPVDAPAPSAAQVRAAVRASPAALLGIAGVGLGHVVMIGLMSMAPVHLDHGGATLAVVGLVISLHVAGMYALSPVFGWLADRAGRPQVLALGAAMLLAAGVVSALSASTDHVLVTVALVLLGLGWSAGLIAGSALLTESLPIAVRPGAQGLADVVMNAGGVVGGIAAGLVVATTSFGVLGVSAAVLVAAYVVVAGARMGPAVRAA